MKFACKMPQKSKQETAAPAVIPFRAGFTLIELLVYMAIMGFIIVVAGRAFSDSTGMRVRSQNMLAGAEEAGRVSALLKEDISQMGAKSFVRSSSSGVVFNTVESVYINFNSSTSAPTADFSSYILMRNSPNTPTESYDSLYFRKVYYDPNGICGAVLGVEWSVRDSVLIRKCKQITQPSAPQCTGVFDGGKECPETLEMARNVTEFRLLPSMPGIEGSSSASGNSSSASWNLVSKGTTGNATASVSGNVRVVTLNGFMQNSSSGTEHADFYLTDGTTNNCKQYTFKAGEIYAIDFELLCTKEVCRDANKSEEDEPYNKMIMFQPGKDHLSVGLRKTDMNGAPISGIPDFMFYPPQSPKANKIRHFEFSVPNDATACVGITAAFYSPEAYGGHLEIQNFKVDRKMDNVYHFDGSSNSNYNPLSASSKAEVKAFKLTIGVKRKNEIVRSEVVIPVPNNGPIPGGN